eukprot:7856164-Pyramimonas_sp.AAC.1
MFTSLPNKQGCALLFRVFGNPHLYNVFDSLRNNSSLCTGFLQILQGTTVTQKLAQTRYISPASPLVVRRSDGSGCTALTSSIAKLVPSEASGEKTRRPVVSRIKTRVTLRSQTKE